MSIRITYFVHGTTTDNEAGLATGWLSGELSAIGRQQAIDLGKQIAERFDVMISSDLERAVQSAELGFNGRFPLLQDVRLRECNYGDWNGGDEQVVKADMLGHIDKPFPGGESYQDVERRVRELIDELKKDYEGKDVAFMAHQAPQLALEVIVNGKSWEEAITGDWRRVGKWQPGWHYEVR